MTPTLPKLQPQTFDSFTDFEKQFEYQGDHLYSMIFERNKEDIKISKAKFATKNLRKIFDATFLLSPKVGFEAMSLRDLSAETGLSMGGLYSSIASKDAIAIMIKDVVAIICSDIVEVSMAQDNAQDSLNVLLKGYIFASTLMQPWFNFLYFETKSLPHAEQEASKNLELAQVNALTTTLKRLKPDTEVNIDFISSMVLSMIQERYVKPWKYHQPFTTVDQYAEDCLLLVYKCMDYQVR